MGDSSAIWCFGFWLYLACEKGSLAMTITDGAIMFIACMFSFTIGYVVGAVRVGRSVSKQLASIRGNMIQIEQHARELRQFYSKVEDDK
jgi:proteasome assembly chaperone (PAC2) family protein